MARRGFKIADAYVEITSDKSGLGREIRDIPRQLGGDADRAGRELGDKLTQGLTRQVEQMSAKVTRARQNEKKATDAVKLAEVKLTEAREKGVEGGSKLLTLTQRLEQAQLKLRDAQESSRTSASRLTETQNKLGEAIRDAAKHVDADSSGQVVGDKLAIGMRMAIIRNSPLIAAGIAAALAAGAPVALGAAAVLFGGIAAVAAAQSNEVQSAWLGAWAQIKQGAIADAADTVPIFVGMADKVAAGFTRMRPLIREAFGDAAPMVDGLVDSLLAMAENALPGMVSGLSGAGPAVAGIGSALEVIGTGLGEFFAILGEHGPAAGEAFDALGRIIAALLPILGELLGSGVELASVVLPPLASILEVVADALSAIAPVLPIVAAGFMGLKVAQSVTGMISGLSGSLAGYAAKGGAAAGIAGRLAGGLGSISGAAGPAAAAIGFLAATIGAWIQLGKSTEELNYNLGRAFQVGGEQADAAGRFIQGFRDRTGGLFDHLPGWVENLGAFGYTIGDLVPSVENATDAYGDWYAALDNLGKRQEDVKVKTDALKQAVDEHGQGSREAQQASAELAQAERALAEEQAKLEQATRGVTDAMLEQTDAALARADSDLAHRMAVDATEDAYRDLQKVLRETPGDTEAVEDASFALERAMLREVAAARQLSEDALPASMDANQRKAASDLAALDALHKLEQQYGEALPASIRQTIADLEASTAGYDQSSIAAAGLVAALGDVGIAAEAIPGEKAVRVEALTDAARQRLEDLGFRVVEMPDGSFQVIADTQEAEANIGQVTTKLAGLDRTKTMPKVGLDDGPFVDTRTKVMTHIAELGRQNPTPKAGLNSIPLLGGVTNALKDLFGLDAQRPTPVSGINNGGLFGGITNALGSVFGLGSQRPTPVSGINNGGLFGGVGQALGSLFGLGSQRPTPTAFLNGGPFGGTANWLFQTMGQIGATRATPWAYLNADVGYANSLLNWAARARYSVIYTTVVGSGSSGSGGTNYRIATGGKIGDKVRGFAAGGKLSGPGGPTEDRIPAATIDGDLLALSNQEWIIRAASAQQYGDRLMAAVNAGTALVSLPPPGRDAVARVRPPATGLASGGPVGDGAGTGGGRTIQIDNLVLQLSGSFDFSKPQDMRRFLVQIREGLIDLEREDA